MIPIIVVEMPLLSPGITCPYCGTAIHDDHVYSVDGQRYRCKGCADKQIARVKELRHEVFIPEVRE
jgi:transposase-like protein